MRLDTYLCENDLAKSRTYAKQLIEAGLVTIDGRVAKKCAIDVNDQKIEVTGSLCPYVSRGGLKLEAALKIFGVETEGTRCIDIGASTGGFTDCLLQHGANSVTCVDCGHDQLDKKLALDKRVTNIEGFNAKQVSPETVGGDYDICVMDVSFISQTLLHPNVASVLKHGGFFVTLIKPQFEAGREALNDKGIVTSDMDRMMSVYKVTSSAEQYGLVQIGSIESPIKGGDGNIEFVAVFQLRG